MRLFRYIPLHDKIWWVRYPDNIYEGRRFREDPAPTINEQGRTHIWALLVICC